MTQSNNVSILRKSQYEKILKSKQNYLNQNINAFKGNTRERNSYINGIPIIRPDGLFPFQKQVVLGLILSDASVEFNASGKSARIKIQQSLAHLPWLVLIANILDEYHTSLDINNKIFNPIQRTIPQKSKMYEWDSMTSPEFIKDCCAPFFTNNTKGQTKRVTKAIEKDFGPAAVAFWFCGDGSKTCEEGKGVDFSTQGFDPQSCQVLIDAMKTCHDLDLRTITDPNNGQILLRLAGSSYDTFIEKIGPYIPSCFNYKVPPGRQPNSRFGFMTINEIVKYLGTSYTYNPNGVIDVTALRNLIYNYES